VIKANIKTVDLPGATLAVDRVERLLARPPTGTNEQGRFDLVLADPPYALTDDAVTRVLTLLQAGWLADDALVVIERATRSGPLDWPPGFLPSKSRRYGEATFWYGWYGSEAGAGHTGTASRSKALNAPHGA
jgi:16S rRNA (guanine966-N2)-methyltransferase